MDNKNLYKSADASVKASTDSKRHEVGTNVDKAEIAKTVDSNGGVEKETSFEERQDAPNNLKRPRKMGGMGGGMGGMGMSMGGKPQNFKKAIRELFSYLKNFLPAIITALIFAVVGTVCSISGPKIVESINKEILRALAAYGEAASKGIIVGIEINFAKIAGIGIVLVGLYIISFILNFLQHFIMAGVSAKASKKMRAEISEKINNLPLSYFDNKSFGDVLSRITNDVDTLGQTLNQSLSSLITSVTMITGIIVMMLTISWQLTLVAVISVPVSMLLIAVIVKFSQKHFIRQQAALGSLNGHIEEIYSAHSVVKINNGAEKEIEEFDKNNNALFSSAYKSQFLSGLMMPVMNFVSNLSYITICILGGWIALKDITFIASIIAFISYVRQLNQPIGQLAQVMGSLQAAAAASERVFEFLNEPEQADENVKTAKIESAQGRVEFQDVVFGYTSEKEIIHGFNCKVEPGQKIAIVGPTGAGKTTLINLLMRFYELNSGTITVDGVSTADMKREDVRRLFGMVLQDTWLFEGTIRENLVFGKPDAAQEEVERAGRAAKIHHYIMTLPGGYNAVLNEETSLSQGQKQLMTIARAMIQNAPMLILDEATSSVDTRTEVLIQEAMDELMKGRTSFVIAHRLSTIKNADLILVMKDGNIIETGNHDKLMSQGGFYRDLYNSQFAKETSV